MSSQFDVIKPSEAGIAPKPPEPVILERPPRDRANPFGGYDLAPDLATAVNVALHLDQPLLVTGEPGCGKTTLAWAVAAQLGAPVYEFHTKSTSVARDLLYTVDTLRRFHDASAKLEESRDARQYVEYQALGRAIRSEHTCVVLIDEIDKAPRDFPNDLLNEIDQMEFDVSEVQPPLHFRSVARHFVLITSNSERRLPPPFLRRCVHAHVEFPDAERLRRIIELHAAHAKVAPSLIDVAVRRFLELRGTPGIAKAPSTSELIAWVSVLDRMGIAPAELERHSPAELPALGVLLKLVEDRNVLVSRD